MPECGFEYQLRLEFSGFSMWHFLKLVVMGLFTIVTIIITIIFLTEVASVA